MNTHVRPTRSPIEAAIALIDGHLVALPTETVYGLGADAENPVAVARIFAAKGRPANHPVIVHLADADAVNAWAQDVRNYAVDLMAAFWPGPLTVILPRGTLATDQLTGGQPSIGLRVPSHPDFQKIIAAFAERTHPAAGIAAPSANRFGRVSPTSAQHVLEELSNVTTDDDLAFDGGACEVGVESTIVDCTGEQPVILRPGAISAEQIEAVTGLSLGTTSTTRASGTLESHYAPRARVHPIDETQIAAITPEAGFIALAHVPTPDDTTRLLAPDDLDAYARGLYAALRDADAQGMTDVFILWPPLAGIGIAINDRVTRAATTSAASEVPHPNE